MRCNLTKLVRCMVVVLMAVVCINTVVFLNSRPGQAVYRLKGGIFRIGPHDDGHVFATRAPKRINSTSTCPGLLMKEPRAQGEFQVIQNTGVYVYSAHLKGSQLVMIALRDKYNFGAPTMCQVWYKLTEGDPLLVTRARIENLPEDHGRKYTSIMIYCSLPDHLRHEIPYSVSLVVNQCELASNIMTVTAPAKMSSQFTVCVTPLNYRYSRAYELVEMVELNKILGADHFVFYNHSTGPNVDKVLEMYSNSGDVEVHQWHLPMKTDTWPPTGEPEIHYFAQMAALNDCLYRHMNRSVYIVYQDIDEFIIPYKHDTWGDLVSDRAKLLANLAVMQFKCVFFRKEWPRPASGFEAVARELKSVVLTNTIREKDYLPFGTRSKYIVNPRKVSVVGVHNVWSFTETVDTVPESEASLHHYRSWERPQESIARTEDEVAAKKYGSRLVERIRNVWSKLEGVPMDINISTYGNYV